MKISNLIAAAAIAFAVTFSTDAFTQHVNHEPIINSSPISNSLDYITRLEPVSFRHSSADVKALKLAGGLNYGFKAEDVQEIVPAVVKTSHKMVPAGKNAYKTVSMKVVDLESLIPLLVGAVKEQQAEIEKLKAEMVVLKQELKK